MNNHRKVFISFLGTNDYLECNYYFGEKKIEKVKFVQEAMIKIFCSDFKENDRIYILLTKEAEEKNWSQLEKRFEKKYKKIIEPIKNIPIGANEEEIWKIFDTLFKLFQANDIIIFDITHGFRLLPLLGITLLNYARFLKDIKISGIYYGAFETLGSISEVQAMNIEDRNAPIFDLTSFYEIMEWGIGAAEFVNSGSTKRIKEISDRIIKPLKKKNFGKVDEAYKNIEKFINLIDIGTNEILFCRGIQILKGENFNKAKGLIDILRQTKTKLSYGLIPIIEKIEEKIKDFKKNDVINGFKAVKWSIGHNLIQQGITILQEMLITYLMEKMGHKNKINQRNIREIVSKAIHIVMNPNCSGKYGEEKDIKEFQVQFNELIKKNSFYKEILQTFEGLRNIRNDINHCGFINPTKIENLRKKLGESFDKIFSAIKKIENIK